MIDTHYTNGVIAVKEKGLLGAKLYRLAEGSAAEALRALAESGFGAGAVSMGGEALCAAEEEALDAFIREYAPSKAQRAYFLLPRDFHNMKALAKAKLLAADPAPMLAPMGLSTVEELKERLENDPPVPWEQLEEGTGAEIGAAFDRALYARLFEICRFDGTLKKLLIGRVDRLNLLTALRSDSPEFFGKAFLAGGKLKKETLALFFEDEERAWEALQGSYDKFSALCREAKERGEPFTEAERVLDTFEGEYFAEHRFELEGKEPFLYYVLRKRAEIANVRILLVCLNAGLKEQDIKRRLRAV